MDRDSSRSGQWPTIGHHDTMYAMDPRHRILALLVLVALFLLLVLARGLLFVMRLAGRRPGALSRLDIFLLAGASLGLLMLAYARFVEPRWLKVEHIRLQVEGMPPSAGPVILVHTSDLHSDGRPLLEPRLPEVVSALNPDVIVFTGDATNRAAGVPIFKNTLRRLVGIAPVFTVRGNRDLGMAEDTDLVGGTGARELEGEAVDLRVRGVSLRIVGSGRPEGWKKVRGLLRSTPKEAFAVYLGHSPDLIESGARWGADLYLAGHTHGGQVALPFYGALFTASRFDKRFESGLYRVGETWLYVNRGLGFQASLPRFRFAARPEVTRIEVSPSLLAVE